MPICSSQLSHKDSARVSAGSAAATNSAVQMPRVWALALAGILGCTERSVRDSKLTIDWEITKSSIS